MLLSSVCQLSQSAFNFQYMRQHSGCSRQVNVLFRQVTFSSCLSSGKSLGKSTAVWKDLSKWGNVLGKQNSSIPWNQNMCPDISFVSYLWSSNCTVINNHTDHMHPWMLQRILIRVDLFNRLPGQNEQNILIKIF